MNSVSFVFHLALKKPGMRPQMPPATMALMAMQRKSITMFILPAKLIIQNAVAMPPTSIWPSAPTFQNRILKAGARPMAIQVRIMQSRMVNHIRLLVPNAQEARET